MTNTTLCPPVQVYFNITIGLHACPDGGEDEDVTVLVRPVGYNESTVVRIHSKCRCRCGPARRCNDGSPSPCSGVQDAPSQEQRPDRGPTMDSNRDSRRDCRVNGSDVDCSGRGVCECGRCVCEQSRLGAVHGKHCEIDDFSCPYDGGLVCGGEAGQTQRRRRSQVEHLFTFASVTACVRLSSSGRGVCVLGECVCEDGWTGDSCGCPVSTDACRAADGSLCSGRGGCVCGKCVCDDARHSGDFCERCPACQISCQSNW